MPVSYTNRKGLRYTLYRGQTRTGKPRYYFGREGQGQGEPVTELPPGFTIDGKCGQRIVRRSGSGISFTSLRTISSEATQRSFPRSAIMNLDIF